jgi:hypothetical protein
MTASMMRKDKAGSTLDLRIDELIAVNNKSARAGPQKFERRRKPRLRESLPARVWGVDSADLPFNVNCVLDNISSTGAYLRMPELLDAGSDVRVVVKLFNGLTKGTTAVLEGWIVRTDLRADGKHGVAVTIENYRFLNVGRRRGNNTLACAVAPGLRRKLP